MFHVNGLKVVLLFCKTLNSGISHFIKYKSMQSEHKKKQILNSCFDEISTITPFLAASSPTTLNKKIIYKDNIKIVISFPCLLGHPVYIGERNTDFSSCEQKVKKEIQGYPQRTKL